MNRNGKRLAALLLAALSLPAGSALAAENATIARDTELRAKPLNDAAVVTALKAKAAVSVLTRSGAWAQVSTADGKSGYVRLFNLRTSSGQKGDSGVGALASVFKTGSSGHSVSTGVKGLSEEDLTDAEPAPAEVEKLAGFQTADRDANESARLAGLKPKAVDYLLPPDGKKKKKRED
ncbi:MAG: SH3 domain-containing protein [Pseudomonadota bacterium]